MARVNGNIQLGLNIEPTGQSILDARLWVATLEELYSAYPTNNYYQDMVVTVGDQKAQYMLIDTTKVTEAAGWKRIDAGGAETIDVIDNLTSTRTDAALSAKQGKVLKDTIDSFSVVKLETPETGMAASYQLQKDGVAVGATINIIKDQFVESGSVVEVDGELVIRLVVNGNNVDIPASSLVDSYTGSTYIDVNGSNVVSLNYESLKTQLDTDLEVSTLKADLNGVTTRLTTAEGTITTNTANISQNSTEITNLRADLNALKDVDNTDSLAYKIGTLETVVGDETSGLVKDVADIKTDLSGYKVKDVNTASSNGVALSLDAATGKVKVIATPATIAAGMNSTQIKVGKAITGGVEIGATQTIDAALQALSDSIETAVSGGITSITSSDETITISGTGTSRGISVNISKLISTNSSIALNNGKLDLQWMEA